MLNLIKLLKFVKNWYLNMIILAIVLNYQNCIIEQIYMARQLIF